MRVRFSRVVAISVFGVAALAGSGFCQAPETRLATDSIYGGLYNAAVVPVPGGCRWVAPEMGTATPKVGGIDDSDWVMYKQIDFGAGSPPYVSINYSADYLAIGKYLVFKIDSLVGTPIVYFRIPMYTGAGWTGDSTVFRDVVNAPAGLHDVYVLGLLDTSSGNTFHNCGGIADLHWFSFTTANNARNGIRSLGAAQKPVMSTQGDAIVARLPAGFGNVRIIAPDGSVVYIASTTARELRIPSGRIPRGYCVMEAKSANEVVSQRIVLTR